MHIRVSVRVQPTFVISLEVCYDHIDLQLQPLNFIFSSYSENCTEFLQALFQFKGKFLIVPFSIFEKHPRHFQQRKIDLQNRALESLVFTDSF